MNPPRTIEGIRALWLTKSVDRAKARLTEHLLSAAPPSSGSDRGDIRGHLPIVAIDCEADDKTSPLQQGIKKMSSTSYNAIVNDADLREAAAKVAASSASSGENGHSWPV